MHNDNSGAAADGTANVVWSRLVWEAPKMLKALDETAEWLYSVASMLDDVGEEELSDEIRERAHQLELVAHKAVFGRQGAR